MERSLESVGRSLELMERSLKLVERSLESMEDLEGVKGPDEGSEAALLLVPTGVALLGLKELERSLERPCAAAAAALGGGLRVKGPAPKPR